MIRYFARCIAAIGLILPATGVATVATASPTQKETLYKGGEFSVTYSPSTGTCVLRGDFPNGGRILLSGSSSFFVLLVGAANWKVAPGGHDLWLRFAYSSGVAGYHFADAVDIPRESNGLPSFPGVAVRYSDAMLTALLGMMTESKSVVVSIDDKQSVTLDLSRAKAAAKMARHCLTIYKIGTFTETQ